MVTFNPSSTAIASLDWDEDTTDLTVTFTDGDRYIYPSFPWRYLVAWLNAPSVGLYYNTVVRGRFGERADVPEEKQHGNF